MIQSNVGTRPKLPKYVETLCTESLSFYPAPYEYIIHQNKHNPYGEPALKNKADKLKKYVLSHDGEFELLTKDSFVQGDILCMKIYFNCAVIYAMAMDEIIKQSEDQKKSKYPSRKYRSFYM